MKTINILGHKVSLRIFNKWIKALRSGKFKQTQGSLNDDSGYCCLGVACKLFIKKPELTTDMKLLGGLPSDQRNAPRWLRSINDDFENRTMEAGDGKLAGEPLSELNDDGTSVLGEETITESLNFNEIADLLEAVYIHKVLD